jgi:hypothetical protein
MSNERRYRQRLSAFAANWRIFGTTRTRRSSIWSRSTLLAGTHLRRAYPDFRSLRPGGWGSRTRARSQIPRARCAKVAPLDRRSSGSNSGTGGSSVALADRERAALRHRAMGRGDERTQDVHYDRTTWRGRERVVAGWQRGFVGALRRDPLGPGGLRSTLSGTIHWCLRGGGRPGAGRLRFPDAGPGSVSASLKAPTTKSISGPEQLVVRYLPGAVENTRLPGISGVDLRPISGIRKG